MIITLLLIKETSFLLISVFMAAPTNTCLKSKIMGVPMFDFTRRGDESLDVQK